MPTDPEQPDRRRLMKLAAASLLLAAGCTSIRQKSDLDTAMSDLNRKLDDISDDERQLKLVSIVQRIKAQARELATEHQTFTDSFDRLLRNHDATEEQLGKLIETYNRRRTLLRNDFLHLQDELHAVLTPDEWNAVVRVLNRAGKSIAGYTLSEG